MVNLIRTTTIDNPLPELNDSNFIVFSIVPNLFYLATDVLWYLGFIRYGTFSFLQIQKVDWVVLANKNGTAIYEYTPLQSERF